MTRTPVQRLRACVHRDQGTMTTEHGTKLVVCRDCGAQRNVGGAFGRWWRPKLVRAVLALACLPLGACDDTTEIQNLRACAIACGSIYVEVLDPKYSRASLCLCPPTGDRGPRGAHWTLSALDGGEP